MSKGSLVFSITGLCVLLLLAFTSMGVRNIQRNAECQAVGSSSHGLPTIRTVATEGMSTIYEVKTSKATYLIFRANTAGIVLLEKEDNVSTDRE